MLEKADKIWLNGKFVKWDDARIHFLTQGFHYGGAVFEGIRCYKTMKGPAIFRLKEHLERLYDSAKILGIKPPKSMAESEKVIIELVKINKLKECYIRPVIFYDYGQMGINVKGAKIGYGIAVWSWGKYLGDEGFEKGISAKISSFSRHHVNVMMTKAKICGNYANSTLAKMEAVNDGYDEAIMLDTQGFVSECSGENIFVVREGVIYTPPRATILEGVTRDSVIQVARHSGFEVLEEQITRDQLYKADEVFLTGTAAEVTPVRMVDGREIGKPGKVTKKLQKLFFEVVSGKNKKFSGWLTFVH